MMYENIFQNDVNYKDKKKDNSAYKKGEADSSTAYNPIERVGLAVIVVDGQIRGLGYGTTLPVTKEDANDNSHHAVAAGGIYIATSSTHKGKDSYTLTQVITVEGEGTENMNPEDYKEGEIPIINPNGEGKHPCEENDKQVNENGKPYARGIKVHHGYGSGTTPGIYPGTGCQLLGMGGSDGDNMLSYAEIMKLLYDNYDTIFVYINRDNFDDYDDYDDYED